MGFKIKNSLTGEFEKLPILTLKGEKGETGGVEEYNKVDYMGNKYETLKQANDANVEYAVKTAIGEFNYLDYEGQHITAAETIEGQSKSAILSGQTLVNIAKNRCNMTLNKTTYYVDLHIAYSLKANTTYAIIGDITTISNAPSGLFLWSTNINSNNSYTKLDITNAGHFIYKYTPSTDIATSRLYLYNDDRENGSITLADVMIIEYQEGMENWDIPYFTGMQSVKMPVLTTTGKNLFDGEVIQGAWNSDTSFVNSKNYVCSKNRIKVKPNTEYTTSNNGSLIALSRLYLREDYSLIELAGGGLSTFTTPSDCHYIRFDYYSSETIDPSVLSNLQIEEGSTATPYEPYKSNILTVNEEVELRGIGDVKDTLDLLTGEVVQNIGEIVLDGSEDEVINLMMSTTNHVKFALPYNGKPYSKSICDSLKQLSEIGSDVEGHYCGTEYFGNISDCGLMLSINKSKLTTPSVDGLKVYLSQNPITIQYELASESIKTVDLSDNHVYSYKDVTHYNCSSAEGSLVPTLSVKVPTDVQATIAQQRETIQTLNSENERLNQIQKALKASMLDSQVQLMNLSWDIDFEVFTLRESIAPKDFLLASRTGSNIGKFSQAKFIIENDCPDLEKLNSQIEYYFSKDVFSQEQFEELTDLISIVKGGNGCEY